MTSFVWNGPTLLLPPDNLVTASIQPPAQSTTIAVNGHVFSTHGLALASSSDQNAILSCKKVNCDEVDALSGRLTLGRSNLFYEDVDCIPNSGEARFYLGSSPNHLAVGDKVFLTQPADVFTRFPSAGVITEGDYYVIASQEGVGNLTSFFDLSATLNGSPITVPGNLNTLVDITRAGDVQAPGGVTTAGSVDCASLTVAGAPVVGKVYGYAALDNQENFTMPSTATHPFGFRVGSISGFDINCAFPNHTIFNATTTSPGFVAPRTGDYKITFSVDCFTDGFGFIAAMAKIVLNYTVVAASQATTLLASSRVIDNNYITGDQLNYQPVYVQWLGRLNVNDEVSFFVYHDSPTARIGGDNDPFYEVLTSICVHNVD